MEGYIKKTISTYDKIADDYPRRTRDLIPINELEKFVSLVPKGAKILDAGCGYGRCSEMLLKKGYDVTGIDLSEKLLEKAKTIKRARFYFMDVRNLDFPEKSFDAVWCNSVLLNLKKQDALKALKEFNHVLKGGGILFINVRKGAKKGMVKEGSSGESRFFRYFLEGEIKDLAGKAGFRILEIYTFNERERLGPDKRDLDLICCFARKRS
jgi:ubiquinone/menaquinone biosynthesis C-methylase UbiE